MNTGGYGADPSNQINTQLLEDENTLLETSLGDKIKELKFVIINLLA